MPGHADVPAREVHGGQEEWAAGSQSSEVELGNGERPTAPTLLSVDHGLLGAVKDVMVETMGKGEFCSWLKCRAPRSWSTAASTASCRPLEVLFCDSNWDLSPWTEKHSFFPQKAQWGHQWIWY